MLPTRKEGGERVLRSQCPSERGSTQGCGVPARGGATFNTSLHTKGCHLRCKCICIATGHWNLEHSSGRESAVVKPKAPVQGLSEAEAAGFSLLHGNSENRRRPSRGVILQARTTSLVSASKPEIFADGSKLKCWERESILILVNGIC